MILTMLFVFVLTTICMGGNGKVWEPTKVERQDVETIAHSICKEVCNIGEVFMGTKGVPILIFEENHLSRAGQIQQAIAMVRLYKQYKLRHIGLEGYLKEDRKIKTDWFDRAARGLALTKKTDIAVRLIKEGEISSAEFMKLAYKDISLHPIETIIEYSVELDKDVNSPSTLYLLKIAYKSLRQEHLQKLQTLQNDFEKLEGEEKEKKRREMFDYILSTDAWVQEKYKSLSGHSVFKKITLEQLVSIVKDIKNRANELSVEFTAKEEEAMDDYIRYLHSRDIASITMVRSVEKIADQSGVSVVAMTVGAAHTEKICKLLKASGRPYAVVTPLSFSFSRKKGDLTIKMLNRKYEKRSIYSEGFMEILRKALSTSTQKKPQPVLSEPWLQGKAELYLFIERIVDRVEQVLANGGSGNRKPPYGFSNEDLKGDWVSINPNRISGIRKDQSVVFPVVLKPNNSSKSTTIWVKAKRNNAMETKTTIIERENVEAMLKKALEEVQSEYEIKNRVEDKGGRVQTALETVAVIAKTKEAAAGTNFTR
jgi:hypothetical protein